GEGIRQGRHQGHLGADQQFLERAAIPQRWLHQFRLDRRFRRLVARINGNPIKSVYVYSPPEWTALVTTKESPVTKGPDLKGKKVAMVRGTDPHIFAVRALLAAGLTDKDITPVLVQQHADGGNLLIRGDVDAWAGLDPMMAQHELTDGARLFYRNRDANTWG